MVLLFVVIDQIVKLVITNKLPLYDSITIIPSFFSLTYVQNIGAAFSILSGRQTFFIVLSIGAIFGIIYYLYKQKTSKGTFISLNLILAGIIGNFIDRIRLGYVIDYMDFQFGSYHFAVFNFADMCIVIGALLLLYYVWKEEKNETSNNK